ncbi:hypothetical protein HCU66_25895 [Pseudomonas frederiksbergensis]|uniref:winged helix-turn-helix domain-containing protein n=1 Tax=Pseudomonas frederiksbergensis TaxID=104087 RepID=UPI00197D1313|nr:winged helix-turn-helix domain-containing protein [Pseudomonas frederiksbergensis]MBN3865633.1 hypothetical protein [Pseudomonas frederiksbergensis]
MLLVFDDCVLDLDRRELLRASQVIATAPQVFDLLVYLAQHCEHVVSRDELINAIWTGRIVSESTLASHINAVRKAVGDDGQQQRVIRTVARKGFRFVAEVKSVDGVGLAGAESVPSVQASASAPALPAKPSIAVLPFVNLSGDEEQDYLADGVVGDIIAALSQYRWLFVVVRNSSFTYKARTVDVKQVGREWGVRYVLEGSWRKASNRVRITAQLIDATTRAHHWAGRFEGVLGDIFELQDQITAIEYFTHAMRLSPLDPELYRMQAGMAAAHLFLGRIDMASSWAEKAFWDLPSFLLVSAVLAASHTLAGRKAEAQRAMDHLHQLDPALRLSNLRDWLPIHRPENLATLVDGLRKAGLPE